MLLPCSGSGLGWAGLGSPGSVSPPPLPACDPTLRPHPSAVSISAGSRRGARTGGGGGGAPTACAHCNIAVRNRGVGCTRPVAPRFKPPRCPPMRRPRWLFNKTALPEVSSASPPPSFLYQPPFTFLCDRTDAEHSGLGSDVMPCFLFPPPQPMLYRRTLEAHRNRAWTWQIDNKKCAIPWPDLDHTSERAGSVNSLVWLA